MPQKQELLLMLRPHYVANFLMCFVFFACKTISPICDTLFDNCEIDVREWEWLTFLGCVIVMKNRKQPSFRVYVSTVVMFLKILNTLMFLRQNALYGVFYILLWGVVFCYLPEPTYSGPDFITYFRGPNLQDELERDKRVTWLVEFYAAWAPTCVHFAPVFAEMSTKYGLDNLKFGKIDASRYSDVAQKFGIDTSSWTKQLPTLILFQNGKEHRRRPVVDHKGRLLVKFVFNEENVVRDFELNELYLQCKRNPIIKRKEREKKADLNGTTAPSPASGEGEMQHSGEGDAKTEGKTKAE